VITAPDSLPIGTVVAERYRLDRLVGTGGFGAVFAAGDLRSPRTVALKIMSSAVLAEAGGIPRFSREADLASRLTHPSVVRVLDAGSDPRGLLFIAFELLDGRSLDRVLLEEGPLAPRRAVAITIDLLAGLDDAHRAGVIHRDIKPGNVFLVRATRGGGGEGVTEAVSGETLKILDFGVAKSQRPNTMALTREGTAMGTPLYMAPEQITGQALGPYSDVFAVGLVLAEALLGQSPWGPAPSAVAVVAERIEGKPMPMPPELLSSPLGPILQRATAPVRLRYGRAEEMRQALLAVLPQLGDAPLVRGRVHGAWVEAPTAVAQAPAARSMSPLASSALADGTTSSRGSARGSLAATVNDDGSPSRPIHLVATVNDDGARRPSRAGAPESRPSAHLAATVLDRPELVSRAAGKRTRWPLYVLGALVLLGLAALGGVYAFQRWGR
jgi:serine/threonine protein kinase